MHSGNEACLREWHAILPKGRILPETGVARYRENCLSLVRRILAVLQPENEAEIVMIVQIASRHRVPLYTISTGHNWGYGTSLPVMDGCAILDLSRMTAIRDFDAELGLVTLEPGVTQQQLFDFMKEHRLDFYVPTTGAGPTTSIVGNALERGFGMTPEEDHFRAVTSVRAVLASGEIYQSCFTEMGAPQAGVWKWGIGPYLDGLFAQGNIGIVTSLQIALAPKAEHTEIYMFTLKDEAGLEQMLEACRGLMADMRGTLGNMKILNRQQLASTIGDAQIGAGLIREFAWMGFGVFRCKKGMVPSIRKEIRRALAAHTSQLTFVNERRNALLNRLSRWIPGKTGAVVKRQLGCIGFLMDLVNGVPRADGLGLVYQHVKMSTIPPVDPVQDGVGVLWYAPVLPMKPALIIRMIGMVQNVLAKYGFTQAISFIVSNEKCAIGVVPLIYKRPEGAETAHQCYRELWERGNALGCPPYRINVGAMPELTGQPGSVYWDSVGKIKAALDPNHILSPGRYAPAAEA
ncbi:MAG: FAD-binding oxidoreductase [Pseudomonadota bacterium]|nr:FAD-binding oxidoreductase [Pseudomonadota bacterium]MDE3038655.1 FAD-binding oxidoreductase [Pseudomonadota bacterium]